MSNKVKRLFLIHGPMDTLLALCRIFDTRDNGVIYEDYAVIASLGVPHEQNGLLVQAIVDMLALHTWEKITDATANDERLRSLIRKQRFDECMELIRAGFGLSMVDELIMYTNRPTLILNFIGRAYESAHIVLTGDGVGILDFACGVGVCRVDEIYPFMPISLCPNLSRCAPLNVIPVETMRRVIAETCENNSALASAFRGQNLPANCALLITQLYAENNYFTLEKEIELYTSAVARACAPGQPIAIKEHPRTKKMNKIGLLRERLTAMGHPCYHLNDPALRHMPAEVICNLFAFSVAICINSTTALTLKHIFPNMTIDCGLSQAELDCAHNGTYIPQSLHNTMLLTVMERLPEWDGQSVLYEFRENPLNLRESYKFGMKTIYEATAKHYYYEQKTLSSFFEEKGIQHLAIFGVGKIGKLMITDLQKRGVLRLYLLDNYTDSTAYCELPICTPREFAGRVDAVLIATIKDTEKICQDLKKLPAFENVAIYTLEDLLFIN